MDGRIGLGWRVDGGGEPTSTKLGIPLGPQKRLILDFVKKKHVSVDIEILKNSTRTDAVFWLM